MRKIIFMTLCLFATQSLAYAQNPSNYSIRRVPKDNQSLINTQNPADYLILQSIGQYSSSGKGRCGEGSGIIGTADHFDEDHNVTTCRTGYYFMQQDLAVSIKVEQHTGGDSDRWLLHEVEDNYHDDETETMGLLTDGAVMRKVNNQRVLWLGIGGGTFRWVSNNVVVSISYTDLQGTKPEPIEVVKAYLTKFPSTITITDAELKASAHNVQWIKDEIDRRLWLCDKWNAQFQAGQNNQNDLIYNLDRNINVFLNYRQKYYGMASENDIITLRAFIRANDLTSIQTKLTEYKTWWNANKGKSISLP